MALTVASASASISNMILSTMALTVAFAFTSIFNIILILCIVASIIIMALTLASASTSSSASAPSNSASTSSSASAPSNYRYDVFLNHYGKDVKDNFASHLYRWLHSHGLQVFLDQPELQRGEKIDPQIEGAIATASVQIAIFSPGYAKSRWCLDELVSMLRSNATVIPVFFKVKPFELRWTDAGAKGLYAEAIANHEKKKRYPPARIAVWREALAEASQIVGYELEKCEGDEGKLVDEVVRQVLKKARLAPLHVATHPIGLDEELQDFETTVLLKKQQNRGRPIILITGSGGVGKTTLVKAFFNKYRSDYERCCFLAEVRGISMVPQWSDGSFQSLGELSNDIDVDVNGLQRLRAPVDCLESLFNRMRQPKLVWLRCAIYEHSSLPSWILLNNSECSLPSWIPLKDLRVLEVVDLMMTWPITEDPMPVLGTLWPENKAQLPLQLRELNISVQLWQVPKSIGSLKYLEKIELHDFQGTLPEGFFYLRSLKYLKLRARNRSMNQLPESFGNLKSLLHLDLSRSEYLQMLPSSLGNLTQLQHMNLSDCKGLQMLPPSLGDLRELQHMKLSGCYRLQMLPPSLGDLRELQHMDLSECRSLKTLPESFMNLIRLKYLDLSDCHALTLSGEIFGNIGTLIRLNFSRCHRLEELPHQVTHQQYLKELILDVCYELKELPSNIGNLGNLEILSLWHCVGNLAAFIR